MFRTANSVVRSTSALALFTLLTAACSAPPLRGTVVTKMGDHESRVHFAAPPDTREGDAVEFFRDTCAYSAPAASNSPNCKMKSVGQGVVARVLNSNDIAVRVDHGVVLRQGDTVQKVGTAPPAVPSARADTAAPMAPIPPPVPAPVAAAAVPPDAGSEAEPEEWPETFDSGDGAIYVDWNARKRTAVIHSASGVYLPPIDLADAPVPKWRCLHVTGIAGSATKDRPTIAVFSVSGGPTCGTTQGRSFVYRFDGSAWTRLLDTQAGELHLRANGPDRVEWKLRSAKEPFDDAAWTTIPLRRFPPPTIP